jgi:hypothetical protein
MMTTLSAGRASLHPTDAKLLRISLTYILPGLAVFYVVLSALWLVPDSYAGMYGNHDGHWASWNGRGILEWSGFLDFSPFSPLVGTGSLFAPNLPWLNPGALALAIPAPLPLRHLASMLVYLVELSASLYLLYRHLEFSREQSFLATMLYVCIFFIPFNGLTLALPWYVLGWGTSGSPSDCFLRSSSRPLCSLPSLRRPLPRPLTFLSTRCCGSRYRFGLMWKRTASSGDAAPSLSLWSF